MRSRDIQNQVDQGQIAFLEKGKTYLRDNCFDADRMLTFVRDCCDKALADGYSGLTATGEMSWHRANPAGSEQLMTYEARLNDICGRPSPTLLCQYEESAFDHSLLLDAVRTHPRVILSGELCMNPYYTPPDEFLSMREGVIPRGTYERTCRDILKRSRLSMIHRMEMRDFRRARMSLSALDDSGLYDIRSLIEVVSFYADLARESCSDPATRSHLDVIVRRCNDAEKRMDSLKAFQSIGRSEPEWLGLDGIIGAISTEVDCCDISTGDHIDGVHVLADHLFAEALQVMLENMPDLRDRSEEVQLEIYRVEDELVLVLEHVGEGVPDSMKDSLFRFEQRYGRSDGFGLFLAAEILSSLGMKIREDGISGKSTRFEIWIPRERHRLALA